ncbi:response regulator [Croceibacterium ferulae]|uniref:response regulator n=1 Tax=Croceibacterium ferulae TaxID=1854641 RepID=UPI000EAF2067|nr:response regulator transcription factor [Croceibacterium ferulae]
MTPSVLIVDDEPAIRRLVRAALERAGHPCAEAGTAAEALVMAARPGCELVLLDLGLPDRDGLELIGLIKALDRSVLVLTARDATAEKVAALDLGADDYVTKPFDTDELLARIRVALRHRTGSDPAGRLQAGPVVLDRAAHRVMLRGAPVHLTPKEFTLLAELLRHAGRVLTHRHLLAAVWGEAHSADIEYLRVAMRALRSKLEDDPARPALLINEPGIGYRIVG